MKLDLRTDLFGADNVNYGYIQGYVITEPDVRIMGEDVYYEFDMAITRLSGTQDIVPVLLPVELIKEDFDFSEVKKGGKVALTGKYKSYHKLINGVYRHVMSLEVDKVLDFDDRLVNNSTTMRGSICKQPHFKVLKPSTKLITDFMLAVNENDDSYYFPCIAWGKNATLISKMTVGTELLINGRMQSREYSKMVNGNVCENMRINEISIDKIKTPKGLTC